MAEEDSSIAGLRLKLKNIFANNYRGLIGAIVIFITVFTFLIATWDKKAKNNMVAAVWMFMSLSFLLHPVAVPVTGFIPIVLFPLLNVFDTAKDCIALVILGNWLLLLLNNCGMDRRMILNIMYTEKEQPFEAVRVMFKASLAAFLLSAVSSCTIVTSIILEILIPTLLNVQSVTNDIDFNFNIMRYIISCAVHISATLGSLVLPLGSFPMICSLGIWTITSDGKKTDHFNFLQYSLFTLPVSLAMFVFVMIIYAVIIKKRISSQVLNETSKIQIGNEFWQCVENEEPNMTSHQKLSCIFAAISFLIYYSRWFSLAKAGWAGFRLEKSGQASKFRDASVSAAMTLLLCGLPKTLDFLKIFSASTRAELPPAKPESGILFWKFMDKNTYYGNMFVFGAGAALNEAFTTSILGNQVVDAYKNTFGNMHWAILLLFMCFVTVFMSNVMTGTAVAVTIMPLFLNIVNVMYASKKTHVVLALGIGSSFGFVAPFISTPAYFTRKTAKVPLKQMLKYGAIPVVVCFIILYLSILLYAPIIFPA